MHSLFREVPTHDAGGAVNSRPALGASMGHGNVSWSTRLLLAVLLLSVTTGLAFAQVATPTPVGTTIRNSATISYLGAGGAPTTITSNQVSATVTPPPSISATSLLRVVTSGSGASSTAGTTQ